ncbi:MupA/Atu3671 family FMN-dependent luciferase-like monooxygenase [Streptomyces sp. V3I7]|uniref:MupA/Atu3671 family FMN-dependent luciferase-like monooxygenase n=1 Tax=Streptomyces sp. V3I7 TaxID=3042278 RepID=UPI0027866B62|nr:MupA/Atu3671 family FMN-dependent luciferase-like monooxygenase [Streptomyces sp. V3I7]MDQ0989115.1 natural product biosynthesis luciferase-like monooxygenase protein [Streptomyces sp. V3I7]
MSELSQRLQKLTPEQRKRLSENLRRREASPTAEPVGASQPKHVLLPKRQSLYFFASASAHAAADYYPLVLEAAKQADQAGLHAIWLPERHFVDFGGFSPNPAVLGAAVAVSTERLGIRAGSVAAPLQHPARITEDWALVDNLSGGRAGVSFASGWHPDDFVLAREDYADRREVTARTIEHVRAHWRGEAVSYPTTAGGKAEVRTQPRPVQAELPVWLTAAGNPATFEAAGRAGYGIMTALLGQTLKALRENVARYRAAWRAAGHEGDGDVVVMAHSYVSDRPDLEEFLRPAMHAYLRSFRSQTTESEQDEEVLLESAYLDFLQGPSLLGTPDKARAVLAELRDAGADEVGHLVDFGLPAADVLAGLPQLLALSADPDPTQAQTAEDPQEQQDPQGVRA